MLEFYSKNAAVNLSAANQETIVPFTTRTLQKGNCATMSGNTVDLNSCGVYSVNAGLCFQGSAASDVTFKLYVDNVAQPQAEKTVSIATIDDYYTVDLSNYVPKNCACNPTNVYITVSASVADLSLTFETTDIQVYRVTK